MHTRPLATFIVGAITLGVMDGGEGKSVLGVVGDIGERVAYRHDQPTKSSDVFFSVGEHIEIPNPSPQIKELPLLLHVPQVLRSNSSHRKVRSKTACAGTSGT